MGYEIILKGVDGIEGENGRTFVEKNSQGRGDDGGNAGFSSAGTNAGEAYLRVSRVQDQQNQVMISGVIVMNEGQRNESFMQVYAFNGPEDKIIIDARGGKGGSGGKGGNGQEGMSGRNGIAATRNTLGTNGTDGMDGGNGGIGTEGSSGGNGGIVEITVAEEDMDLLFYFGDISVSGGTAGQAGVHGKGGQGGTGGKGGSPCAWHTEQTMMERNQYGQMMTVLKKTNHYNKAGVDGKTGKRGVDGGIGYSPLKAGEAGKNGTLKFVIESGEQRIEYDDRFKLKVTEYSIKYEDDDGIVEPGEICHIHSVKVQNVGKMPTPIHADLRL